MQDSISVLNIKDPNTGEFIGIPTIKGEDGQNGKSAYQAAKEAGYTGTEADFNKVLNDTPGHINNKANPHGVTITQIGAAAANHSHNAWDIGAIDKRHRDFLTNANKNDPNFPYSYETCIPDGTQIGLPGGWWHLKYFRHDDNNGFGAQLAISLTGENQMYFRSSNGLAWNAWTKIATNDSTDVLIQLVWTNAAPNSQFVAQNISLNLSEYNGVLIDFKGYYQDADTGSGIFNDGVHLFSYAAKKQQGYVLCYWGASSDRWFFVHDGGVNFYGGRHFSYYGNNTSSLDNTSLIPIKIYGVKGGPIK